MLVPLLRALQAATPSRPKLLTVGGLDVVATGVANSYGVAPESITVREAGPGQVSDMTLTITDPSAQVAIADGLPVSYWDNTRDMPIFRGWVESYRVRDFGIGRAIEVKCIGIEAVLDWLYSPAITIPAGLTWVGAWQSLVANALGSAGIALNVNADPVGGLSTVAHPVEAPASTTLGAIAVPAGSLRQALQAFTDAALAESALTSVTFLFTVDFYGGLRVGIWSLLYPPTTLYDDYAIATFSDAGPVRPSRLVWGYNDSGTPRSAYVNGTGAGLGIVSDGSGLPGPTAVIGDATINTQPKRDALAAIYLRSNAGAASGSVTAEGGLTLGTPAAQVRPPAPVRITHAGVGLTSATDFVMRAIVKTWAPSGEETWTIEFGGYAPRGSQYLRTLTNDRLV